MRRLYADWSKLEQGKGKFSRAQLVVPLALMLFVPSVSLISCFLVRDSSSVPNSYVLTMFAKSVPKNFQIMPVSELVGSILDHLSRPMTASLLSSHSMKLLEVELCTGLTMDQPFMPLMTCCTTTSLNQIAFPAG